MEPDHIRQLAEKSDLDNLLQLRNLLLYVLAISGFFRSSEYCEIRSSHIAFSKGYVSVKVEKGETDQLREEGKRKKLVSANKRIAYTTYRGGV